MAFLGIVLSMTIANRWMRVEDPRPMSHRTSPLSSGDEKRSGSCLRALWVLTVCLQAPDFHNVRLRG